MDVVEGYLARIKDRDEEVRAWANLDADQARAQARYVDRVAARSEVHGWTVGIKDNIDTKSHPTSYGSPIWFGHRPQHDAMVVRSLRQAGAIVLGKTTTTEFATFKAPQTSNPYDVRRSPGGSSSGSAAAVADGQVRVAIGTQTAGSVLRPASFCGVYGFKPTYARWPITGTQLLAPSFDTLGAFAREIGDLTNLDRILAPSDRAISNSADLAAPLRIGILRQPWHSRAAPEVWLMLDQLADRLADDTTEVSDIDASPILIDLEQAHTITFLLEANYWLAPLFRPHPDLVSQELRLELARAAATSAHRVQQARTILREARDFVLRVFEDVDLIMMPAAPDEAPMDLTWTGDPVFNRLASVTGSPAMSVPAGTGQNGMPLGAQFLARPHCDRMLLAALSALTAQHRLPSPPPVPPILS